MVTTPIFGVVALVLCLAGLALLANFALVEGHISGRKRAVVLGLVCALVGTAALFFRTILDSDARVPSNRTTTDSLLYGFALPRGTRVDSAMIRAWQDSGRVYSDSVFLTRVALTGLSATAVLHNDTRETIEPSAAFLFYLSSDHRIIGSHHCALGPSLPIPQFRLCTIAPLSLPAHYVADLVVSLDNLPSLAVRDTVGLAVSYRVRRARL